MLTDTIQTFEKKQNINTINVSNKILYYYYVIIL